MKIQKIIFTIDDNPHYKGFWKSISTHYKTRLGMDCKLFVIGDKSTDMSEYEVEHGETEFIQKLDNIPTIIQALMGKFYFTTTELDTVWMVGDLDLYPLQSYQFIDRIKDVSDTMYVHLNPYAYSVNWRSRFEGLAGYYHVGKGSTFKKELRMTTFEDFCNAVYKSNQYGIKFHGQSGGEINRKASKDDFGWFCCEEMYTGELLRDCKKLVELPPILPNFPWLPSAYHRIDRSDMRWDHEMLQNQGYIDMHSPRPYEDHQKVIEKIIAIPFSEPSL